MISPLRNSFEKSIETQLKKANVEYEYERTRLPFTISGWYIPDFTLPGPVYVEVKGYLRPETKRKMVGVRKSSPTADIRFVFQTREGTKSGRSYARWAEKNGFKYAFERIPEDWLEASVIKKRKTK